MRPALIAHILPWAGLAGTEIATFRLAQAARKAGYGSVVYIPKEDGYPAVEAYGRDLGIETALYEPVPPWRRKALSYGLNQMQLALDFRRRGVGLVHSSDLLGLNYAAPAARLAGLPLITHVRCDYPHLDSTEQAMLKLAQRFVFVSRSTRDTLDFPVPVDRGEILYDGVNPPLVETTRADARRHYGLPEDVIVIGMAARLNAQKDHDTLIRAMQILRAQGREAVLLCAGATGDPVQNPIFRDALALVAEAGLQDCVRFHGYEPRMERFYAAIDIFALSTHFEGFPLVLLEAMSTGRPVVASRVSGIPELITDDETGFTVPESDPQAFAATLEPLIMNAELRERIGAAGAALVRTQFSEAIYEQAVSRLYARYMERASDIKPEGPGRGVLASLLGIKNRRA